MCKSTSCFRLVLAAVLFAMPATQAPVLADAPAFRAFWADVFHYGLQNQTQIDAMIAKAVQGNYNAIIPEVLAYHDNQVGSHGAYWHSDIVARSTYASGSFDPLAYMVQQAHANGLEIHAWMVAFRASSTWPPPGNSTLAAHPEWLMVPQASMGSVTTVGGAYTLDAGSPDVQEYLVSIVKELVTNYAIDGIHWDYIRFTQADAGYPTDTSYTKSSLARFKQITGYVGTPSSSYAPWNDFRRRTIDELIRRCRAEIAAIDSNPQQPLRHTAALIPWGNAPSNFADSSAYGLFQNWEFWMREGYLDAGCPMLYYREHDSSQYLWYRNWVNACLNWRYDRHMYLGQAAYLNTMPNSITQLGYSLGQGANGVVTYSYGVTRSDSSDYDAWYPYVASNLFTATAATPTMPWRDPATATEGTLFGQITDSNTGEPVDNATVQIGVLAPVLTDGNGYYVKTLIPASAGGTTYAITATKAGLPDGFNPAATVIAGDVQRYDIALGSVTCVNNSDCDDGLFCNGAEVCDPALGCLPGTDPCPGQLCDEGADACVECLNNADCDDGLYCNGTETCNAGVCEPGLPVACDDGVGCTADACNEATDACENVPNNAVCDNGAFCDGVETCDPQLGCQPGTPVTCDDGVGCTADSCNEATDSCDHVGSDSLCDNGLFCDGVETCDPVLDCQPGTDPCPGQACDEEMNTCVQCLNNADCDDGLYCNGTETCNAGVCEPGLPVACDDGVGCTADACNEATDACENVPNNAVCDNGLFCDGAEVCDPQLDCQSGNDPCPGLICDEDGDACIDLSCNQNGVCEPGEDCATCPSDCISGSGGGCGNGVCEPGLGEDCVSCPSDCAGKQDGVPKRRFCCGDGDGINPVGCEDARCTDAALGVTCDADGAEPYCCGDGVCGGLETSDNCALDCGEPAICGDAVCDPDEDSCNCPDDCGIPPATETSCTDGADEDCDGLTDCADSDCDADPACSCLPRDDACSDNGECCSNWCHRGVCK